MMVDSFFYDTDGPVPVDIAIDPDKGFDSEACREWEAMEEEQDELYGFHIVNP